MRVNWTIAWPMGFDKRESTSIARIFLCHRAGFGAVLPAEATVLPIGDTGRPDRYNAENGMKCRDLKRAGMRAGCGTRTFFAARSPICADERL